jgi:hypothetical protein
MLLLCAVTGLLIGVVESGASSRGRKCVLISDPESAEITLVPIPKNVSVVNFSEQVEIEAPFGDSKYPCRRYFGIGFFATPDVEIRRCEKSASIQEFRIVFAFLNEVGNIVNWLVFERQHGIIRDIKSRALAIVGYHGIWVKVLTRLDDSVYLLNANPSSLVYMKGFGSDASKHYVNDYGRTYEDHHNDFSQSRRRALAGLVWIFVSWFGHGLWVYFLARGIHDRLLREVGGALVLLPFSVLATCHGSTLLFSI